MDLTLVWVVNLMLWNRVNITPQETEKIAKTHMTILHPVKINVYQATTFPSKKTNTKVIASTWSGEEIR